MREKRLVSLDSYDIYVKAEGKQDVLIEQSVFQDCEIPGNDYRGENLFPRKRLSGRKRSFWGDIKQ